MPSAIAPGDDIYEIDTVLCTECVGHYDEPQCQQVCPVDCIEKNPDCPETQEELLEKYQIITSAA